MTHGEDKKSTDQIEQMIKTPRGIADVISKEHGIGHGSVSRAEKRGFLSYLSDSTRFDTTPSFTPNSFYFILPHFTLKPANRCKH